MRFVHIAVVAAMVAAILASPLKGETWVVLAKPYYEVIGTFELEKGGMVDVDVDTRQQCLKLFEITEIPLDLIKVIATTATQALVDGKSVPVVTVTISKAKIEEGFAKQKYRYDLLGTGFKEVSKEVKDL